jgi:hypothetical protein
MARKSNILQYPLDHFKASGYRVTAVENHWSRSFRLDQIYLRTFFFLLSTQLNETFEAVDGLSSMVYKIEIPTKQGQDSQNFLGEFLRFSQLYTLKCQACIKS